jgi:WD40 repeat protein
MLLVAAYFVAPLVAQTQIVTSPPITAAAFAPDGRSIAVGSQSGITLYSWPGLQQQGQLATRMAHVHDLTFSPQGDLLAAAGGSPAESGEVELFDWPGGQLSARHRPHADLVYRLAWNSDGRSWVTASADGQVLLHGPGDRRIELTGHSRGVLAAVYLPAAETIVSAGLDHSLRIWEASTGRLLRTLDNHTAAVRDVAARPGGSDSLPMIASAGADRTVRLWQPTIGRLVRFLRLPVEPLDLEWSSDGRWLLVACTDGHLRLIDPDNVHLLADIPAIDGWAYTVAADPGKQQALVGGIRGQLRVVSFETRDSP